MQLSRDHRSRRIIRHATMPDPTLPLLHSDIHASFTWGGETATLHAQRAAAGSDAAAPDWFYLELPDGTFHEVQGSRLRHFLLRAHACATVESLAHAFSHEQDQCPAHLLEIARACGL